MKRSYIKRNPQAIREWLDRSRQRARDRARERSGDDIGAQAVSSPKLAVSTLKPGKRKRKARIPDGMRRRVYVRSGGACICGCGRRATTIHHVMPEQTFPELAKNEANLVGAYHDCHARHESAFRRFRRDRLPLCAIALASTEPSYWVYLERTYPEAEAVAA